MSYIGIDFEPVFKDKNLTHFQKVVYFYLSYRGGKNGVCWLKQETIATDLNNSIRSVCYAIEALSVRGMITLSKRGKLRTYTINRLKPLQSVAGDAQSTQPVAENLRNQLQSRINKRERNGMVYGTPNPAKPGFSEQNSFRFKPDLDENADALNQLYSWIEKYNDDNGFSGNERRQLQIQAMADFLEILKRGTLSDGQTVSDPAALLKSRLESTFECVVGCWAWERATEEREKLKSGQAVSFHAFGKNRELKGPLRRVEV